MRRIKFRGKATQIDGNPWIYGFYHEVDAEEIINHYIFWQGNVHLVDPESVGQLTELKDKNGKDIYEGDILQFKTATGRIEEFIVKYGIHHCEIASGWLVDIPGFSFVSSDGFPSFPIIKNYVGKHDLNMIEVIANVFDNPELLNK